MCWRHRGGCVGCDGLGVMDAQGWVWQAGQHRGMGEGNTHSNVFTETGRRGGTVRMRSPVH